MAGNATIYGLGDANVSSTSPITDPKLYHRFRCGLSLTGTVVAAKQYHGPVLKPGTILGYQAAITETIATGVDRVVTVDLQKSTGGGAFASVLSAPITFGSSDTLCLAKSAVISSGTLAAGDILLEVVTVSGSAGAQALGLVAGAMIVEQP